MGKLLGNTHAWKCSEQVNLMNEAKNLLNQQQFGVGRPVNAHMLDRAFSND